MAEWRAEWTGSWPSLCSGEWHLYRDGEEVGGIPFRECPADTLGTYSCWYFDEDWLEHFEDYEDGMDEAEWIDEHRGWLSTIADEDDFPKVYRAFQERDFRTGECGGCI